MSGVGFLSVPGLLRVLSRRVQLSRKVRQALGDVAPMSSLTDDRRASDAAGNDHA